MDFTIYELIRELDQFSVQALFSHCPIVKLKCTQINSTCILVQMQKFHKYKILHELSFQI